MNRFRTLVYNIFSPKVRKKLGKSKILKPFRDLFFRKNGSYRETSSKVKRQYLDYLVEFTFFASIQVAAKAKERGMENTLLRHSIQLLKTYKKRKKNDYMVFDVGTNFGYLSLVWAKTVCQQGKVYSFEPHPMLFKSYLKSINSNKLDTCVVPENLAIGNDLTEIEVNILSTTANVLNDFTDQKLEKKCLVEMITLDSYVKKNNLIRCDLIKIDVDGIELDILNGAKVIIKKFQPILIIETNNDTRIIEFVKNLDYRILDMKLNRYKENTDLPLNIFCVPNFLFD